MLERLRVLRYQLVELSAQLKNSKRQLKDLSIEIKHLEQSAELPSRLNELRDEAETLKVSIQDLNNAYSLLKIKEQHLLQVKKMGGKTEGYGMNSHFLLFSKKEKEKRREAPSLLVYKLGLHK